MKNIILKISILFFALVALFTACKKDDVSPSSTTQTQSASFNITPVVGSSAFSFANTFSGYNNARFTVANFRYYVSNIRFVKTDGSETTLTGKYLLVNPNTANYDLGQVPVGDYKAIKFNLGIDSVTNHGDPTKYSVDNPLAPQSPAIFWSWNSGYIFTMLEGTVDTTANNTDVLTYGSFTKALTIHVGADVNRRSVTLNTSFTVSSSSSKIIKLQTDVNKLFTNIDLRTNNTTHSIFFNPTLANKVADNSVNAFTVIP